MTDSNDPFASPSDRPGLVTPDPATQPGMVPSTPGMMAPPPGMVGGVPEYQPFPTPPVGATSGGWLPEAPTKLALWATILTGIVTLIGFWGAIMSPQTVETTKEALADPTNVSPFAGVDAVSLLSTPMLIASFITLAMWMNRMRSIRVANGEHVTGPPAVEWWGWFVPLANFVLPYLGMRGITRGRVGLGVLLGWWLTYCLYWIVGGFITPLLSFFAIDFTTGELSNPEALDALVPFSWASAVLLGVSWVFLAVTIRTTTDKARTSA